MLLFVYLKHWFQYIESNIKIGNTLVGPPYTHVLITSIASITSFLEIYQSKPKQLDNVVLIYGA